MASTESVYGFLRTRKKEVRTATIANHFLISIHAANAHLRKLNEARKITKTKRSRHYYWEVVRVAIPNESPEPRLATPVIAKPNPIQNSYPFIRGYDD